MDEIKHYSGADMFQVLVDSMSIRAGKEEVCLKCGAQRYIDRTFPQYGDRVFRVPIACPCTQEAAERQRQDDITKAKRERHERSIPYAGHRLMTFAASDEPIKIARRYADICVQGGEDWERFKKDYNGLIFSGGTGTGKTYAAAAIANEIFDNGCSVYMANVAEISAKMGDNYGGGRETILQYATNVGLFVIDDYGATRDTDFVIQGLYELIDARNESGKQMIVTTNVDITALANTDDTRIKRITSRLSKLFPVKITGSDKRMKRAVDAYGRAKSILEG